MDIFTLFIIKFIPIIKNKFSNSSLYHIELLISMVIHKKYKEYSFYLVVDACAMMFPPIGFLGSAENIAAPSTWATT